MRVNLINLSRQWEEDLPKLLPNLKKTLKSGQYVGGSLIEKIESKISKKIGVKYTVTLNIMDSINNFESKEIVINIIKPGVSSLLFKFAHKFSFMYGLFSAIVAIGFGLTAGLMFRRYF